MTTINELIDWLKSDDHITTILVEITYVQGGPTTLYLGNRPFTTKPTDTPQNQFYDPCLIGGISFNENLSLDGSVRVSFGDLEIDNTGGSKDAWFDYILVNRPINIYIGDSRWNRNDFYLIFSGLIADISSRNLSSINIILVDKLQRLNNPITDEKLPIVNTTNDVLVPLTFGEVFNVTPVITDNVINTLEYQVHDGPVEDIIEVRDNGIPVSITKNLANGKFNLLQSPYGQITCSVQGHKNVTYYNDIANIIKEIVKNYGPVTTRLTDSDIDLTNFSNFSAAHPDYVGIYAKNGENILTLCNQLAGSVGAQVVMSSTGKLKLVQLTIPGTGTAYAISYNDIEDSSLQIKEKPEVKAATKLAYCKNWTTQTGTIAAGVPSQNISLFEEEWLFTTTVNSTTETDYKLSGEEKEETTMLVNKVQAEAECARRNDLWDTARYVYTMIGYAHLLVLELGDTITLTDDRFGLLSGKVGTCVSLQKDWLRNRVTIGVLI